MNPPTPIPKVAPGEADRGEADRARADDPGVVVLYDGDCGLCSFSVQWMIDHDAAGRVRYASLQGPFGRSKLARFGIPDDLAGVVVIDEGRAFRKSTAALRALRHCDAPWRWLAWTVMIPVGVRDAVYDFIADHRIRWFGRADSCRRPTPAVAARMLD